jgi:hypothetical protein
MEGPDMLTFALMPQDALRLVSFFDNFRTEDIYKERIGMPDGTDISMERCFVFPYKEYGEAKEACLAVKDNSLYLMLIFSNYRVVYSLLAEKQWNSVEVEAFAGTLVKYNYDFFNRLSSAHVTEIENYFKGKLVAGKDNLYNILGSTASDPEFLQRFMYSIVLK